MHGAGLPFRCANGVSICFLLPRAPRSVLTTIGRQLQEQHGNNGSVKAASTGCRAPGQCGGHVPGVCTMGSAYVAKFFEAMGAQSCQAFRLPGAPWTSRMHQQMGQDRCRIALEATAGLFESKIGRCEEARGVTARRQLCVACLPARVRRSAWRSTALWLLASLQSCWKLLALNSAPTSWSCKTPTSVTASAA